MRQVENDKHKFVLYDAGESHTKKGVQPDQIRAEHAAFMYRFIPAQQGKMRKISVLLPAVKKSTYGISKLTK